MQCHHCPKRFFDRREFEIHRQSHSDRQREIRSGDTEIGAFLNACAPDGPRKVVLQATTLLSQWKGNAPDGGGGTASDIRTFQDALRKFPSRTDKDGNATEVKDVFCRNCEAVFSSTAELSQHHLTKFCPGAAIVVYVMIRDRLMEKGYRVEKRLVPLDGHRLRVPCGKCPATFFDDEAKDAHESLHPTHNLICLQCGRTCDTPYELKLHYDFHEDMEFRQLREEVVAPSHKRTSSDPRAKHYPTTPRVTSSASETVIKRLTKRSSQRLLNAWPLRKYGQGDDGELVAIGFSLPEDLERVHAADGVIQEVEPNTVVDFPVAQFTTWLDTPDTVTPDADDKFFATTLCEDEEKYLKEADDSTNDPSSKDLQTEAKEEDTRPRRNSFFRAVLGFKLPKRLSRSESGASQPRKLLKRENAVRFSFVSKGSKSINTSSRSESRTSRRMSEQQDGRKSPGPNLPSNIPATQDGEQEPGGSNRSPFIHLRMTSDGAVVEDVSGRQRILPMELVAYIYSIISRDFSSTATRTKIGALQSRAEMNLQQGHPKAAIAAYREILDILRQNPTMDIDLSSTAGVLHRLGYAYSSLGLAGESESCYLQALAIYRRAYGRDYPPNFTILNDLAILCEQDGYATEAAELYERALAGRLRVLGQHAPETLGTMQELAKIKICLGDLESALVLFEEVVPAFETVLGLQNESTLNAMNNLSMLYHKLGLNDQSLTVLRKMLPHCKTAVGIDSPLTRNAITRYVQESSNFDFPPEVKHVLDHYRRSRLADNLRVLQGLGRAYMNAGLNRDACELFELLFEEFSAIKGADSLESFDALSGLCVSLEYLGSLDKAIQSYGRLLQLAHKTPPDHPARVRMEYARKRVTDLIHRREVLTAERRAWSLFEEGPCLTCQSNTSCLCSTCHIVRFCSEACHDKGRQTHQPSCITSVTLRESKSVAITPRCPSPVQKDAVSMIVPGEHNGAAPGITAGHTVYLDPRNFTTFRMKLSSTVNTLLVFSVEADIRYTIVGNITESDSDVVPPQPPPIVTSSRHQKKQQPSPSSTPTPSSSSRSPRLAPGDWLTPSQQESVCITPMAQSAPIYLIVAPGKQMMKKTVARRVKARGGGGEKERFEALTVPNEELIEFSQGLPLNGYMGEAFLYIVEWV
ncbi:hypothetical protein VTN77DRAFT_5415 [Rasamsonia byssochlamydoides]|uniref:uncharacterized protein n=1 Tax=Rasamsonia byssochlamydoides TaxID=89139 RepID=UPI003742755C